MKYSYYIFPSLFCIVFILIQSACRQHKSISSGIQQKETKVKVKKNERGVLFRRFAGGVDTSMVYLPGSYRISAFDRFIVYSIASQTATDILEVLSKDGIKIDLAIEYSFRPIPEKIALLHYYIGANYSEIIVESEIHKAAEVYLKNLNATQVIMGNKDKIEDQILALAKEAMINKYIDLEVFIVKNIKK